MQRRQGGWAGVELLILIPVLIILAIVAFRIYRSNQSAPGKSAEQPVTVPQIKDDSGLTAADQQLQTTDLEDDSDQKTLDRLGNF